MLKPKALVFLLSCVLLAQFSPAQTKKKVASQSDLPRFTYPMTMPASELLQADQATFNGFADTLAKTGGPADPAERMKRADESYNIWHDAVENAIKGAPGTLFVCAAGNSDSDASFLRDVPAGLRLPNLIAVGAVNQAGDETSFTSYGPTVAVDANGYEVESYIPGGARVRLSGTSMASPNLAAKLFALNPSLTPAQAIDLIKRGASTSEDGRRHLIDEKKSVELLPSGKAQAAGAH